MQNDNDPPEEAGRRTERRHDGSWTRGTGRCEAGESRADGAESERRTGYPDWEADAGGVLHAAFAKAEPEYAHVRGRRPCDEGEVRGEESS